MRKTIRTQAFAAAAIMVAAVGVSGVQASDDNSWASARFSGSGSGYSSGSKGTRVASRGDTRSDYAPRSLSGGSGGVRWVASAGCLNSTLRGTIESVASSYGSVTVSSTCRSHASNRAAGGAPKSHHLSGDAADFRVHGANPGAVYASLRNNPSLGGVKHYGGGLFHIDTGPRRSW